MKKLFIILIIASYTILNSAEIKGQGFLKTQGGEIRTCAGNSVYLTIATNDEKDYVVLKGFSELTKKILASKQLRGDAKEKDIQTVKKYENMLLQIPKNKYFISQCDAQGNFKFKNIKNGKYSIGTTVEWYVGKEKQGGFIFKIVNINGNQDNLFITE